MKETTYIWNREGQKLTDQIVSPSTSQTKICIKVAVPPCPPAHYSHVSLITSHTSMCTPSLPLLVQDISS